MIIVIMQQQNPAAPEQPPQLQLTWEGAEPPQVRATLEQMIQVIDHQFPPEGGGAKSRLIVPQPSVPKDILNNNDPLGPGRH